jgi:cupin superfamily acireductone dioxygenase involved in methionine salvage
MEFDLKELPDDAEKLKELIASFSREHEKSQEKILY